MPDDVGVAARSFPMAKKKKKKPAPGEPVKGRDFRYETYFVGGKMKRIRIPLIGGLPVEDFLRAHADDCFLAAEGYYELLHERQCERDGFPGAAIEDDLFPLAPKPDRVERAPSDDDLPF